jgi:hypothetical protein
VALIIYVNNNLCNNILSVNDEVISLGKNVKNLTNGLDEKITRTNQQINLMTDQYIKRFDHIDNKIDLVDNKTVNLEETVQLMGKDLIKVNELSNNSVLALSKQSLTLSNQATAALTEIAEASTTVEGTTIGLAKI